MAYDDTLESTPEHCLECLSPFRIPSFTTEEIAEEDKDLCGGCRAIRKAVSVERWKKYILTTSDRISNDWSKDNDVVPLWKSGYEKID